MNNLTKKIFASLGIVLVLFVSSFHTTLAQTNWYMPTYGEFNTKIYDAPAEEIFGERYTQAQVYWIIYSLINFFASGTFAECISKLSTQAAVTTDQLQGCADEAGTVGSMGPILDLAGIADTIRNTKPASGIQYVSQKLDIVDDVNAQVAGNGVGYTTLSGAQYLWGAARNMAYGLMVLVVIVLAFGIMLRVKLNPQTVITIQSALPKVVIALIAITFSFAIAGLLIDLAFLVQGVVASFMYASGLIRPGNPGLADFLRVLNSPSSGLLGYGAVVVTVAIIPALALGTIGGALIPGLGSTIGFIGGSIFLLLLLLVFIIALVKLIWLFLRTYAVLMINIVFAPFIILGGAVNLGGGLMGWIKTMVAQLSVFVVASLLILLAHVFMWGSNFAGSANGENVFAQSSFLNPFYIQTDQTQGAGSLGSAVVPGFGSVDPGVLGFAVGLVVLLSIPALSSFVRDSISKPARIDLGIGGAFGVIPMGMGMAAGRYYSSGRGGEKLASLERQAKAAENNWKSNPNDPFYQIEYDNATKRFRNAQSTADTVQSIARGKFGGRR